MSHHLLTGANPMKTPLNMAPSPLRRQAIDTFRRSRKMPPGRFRDDLRQLAFALWNLYNRGLKANVQMLDGPSEASSSIARRAASHNAVSHSDSIHRPPRGDLQRL